MKTIFSFIAALITMGMISSCEQCKTCSGEVSQEVYQDTVLIATQDLATTEIEVCGEDLEEIEMNPEVTTTLTQNVGGFVQESITTTKYTCQ